MRSVHISRTLRTSCVWRHVSPYVKKLQFLNQHDFIARKTTESETFSLVLSDVSTGSRSGYISSHRYQPINFIHSNDGFILYRYESISFTYSKYGLTLYIYESKPSSCNTFQCSLNPQHKFNLDSFNFLSNGHTDMRLDMHGLYLHEFTSYRISISEHTEW